MWMICKTCLAAAVLAGCTAASQSQLVHDVRVGSQTNSFLQTHEVASWSIRSYTDHRGDRWPAGLTLGARSVQRHDGSQSHYLMLRTAKISDDDEATVYEQVRQQRRQLLQDCKTMTLVLDGRALVLPVTSIAVRALTNSRRMPVPPTDTTPDPVEVMVGQNTGERFVVSTSVLGLIEQDIWQQLASVQTLGYELCGESGTASADELDGLREVVDLSTQKTKAL